MKPSTRSFYHQAVGAAVAEIAASLDLAVDLERLAGLAGLSPFHFHRVFRGLAGESPMEMLRRLRMERAAWRLATSDLGVTRIAFEAGYETHEAFTRAFRSWFSTSPTGFRRRRHPRVELAAPSGVHFSPPEGATAWHPLDLGGQTMEVSIVEIPAIRVGAVRHTGPYNQIPVAFGKLGQIAGPAGLFGLPGAAMIALYHDDPDTTPQDQLRSEAGIAVPEGVALPAGLEEHRIPGGRYARTVHRGGYELLGDTWARLLGGWLPTSGHRMGSGPSFERYLNDPSRVPKEALETEVMIPLSE